MPSFDPIPAPGHSLYPYLLAPLDLGLPPLKNRVPMGHMHPGLQGKGAVDTLRNPYFTFASHGSVDGFHYARKRCLPGKAIINARNIIGINVPYLDRNRARPRITRLRNQRTRR